MADRKRSMAIVVGAAVMGLWIGSGIAAANEEKGLEAESAQHQVTFDKAAMGGSLNGDLVVAVRAAQTKVFQVTVAQPARTGVSVPAPATAKSPNPQPKGRVSRAVATIVLALTALAVLTGCMKPPTEATQKESCDYNVNAIKVLGDGVSKTQTAAQNAGNMADHQWTSGELRSHTEGYYEQIYDPTTESYLSVYRERVIESDYELETHAVLWDIEHAESNIRNAADKVNQASLYAPKCGPEAVQAITAARQAVDGARSALTEAKNSVASGPNTQQSQDAAARAMELSRQALANATQAQDFVAKAVASIPPAG